jgi:hypothetical protein
MSNEHHKKEIPQTEIRHSGVSYDRTDLGARAIFLALLGFALLIGLIHFVSWGILRYLSDFQMATPSSGPVNIARMAVVPKGDPALRFPTPALQPDEVSDLNKFTASEREVLNEYGWVNQQAGVVRIPISRAIDLIAERGLPTRPDAGVPADRTFGSSPVLGGGVVPLPGDSPARIEASGPGSITLPVSSGTGQTESQPSGKQGQSSPRPQEKQ